MQWFPLILRLKPAAGRGNARTPPSRCRLTNDRRPLNNVPDARRPAWLVTIEGHRAMNNLIYIVGLVVVVLAVLAFFGLR